MSDAIPHATRAGRAARENTPAELDAFATVCDRLMGFEHALSPYRIDGWLTVLAAGPVRPPTDEWLQHMCGDAFDRAFADPPDRMHALAVLQTRLIVLHDELDAEALLREPDQVRLNPFLDEWTDEDRSNLLGDGEASAAEVGLLHAGALWAVGVLDGLEDLAELWSLPENEEVEVAMQQMSDQIEGLLLDHTSDDWRDFLAHYHGGKEPERDELIANACFALQDMRLFLLDHGPRPETRRVAQQPGRNDPCPCGSGKKFKKCHGV